MTKIDRDFHLMNDYHDRRNRPTPWDSYLVVAAFVIVIILILLGVI